MSQMESVSSSLSTNLQNPLLASSPKPQNFKKGLVVFFIKATTLRSLSFEEDLNFKELERMAAYTNGYDRDGHPVCYHAYADEALPPPPPVPADVVPLRVEGDSEPVVKKPPVRVPIARRGLASKGNKVQFLTNHFKVNVTNVDGHFFHYSVALFYEDGRPVKGKGIGRKVLDRVHDTYKAELEGKDFAYDGEKSLLLLELFQETR
ncbi:hypothetical protein POM88_039519 [Heracleum sosnowskyi]|uniref:Protein argonaute N-terminal domain-containing protein n=1 Tax=Heracleum sosnowskyi TaxID=360622 RepID=A0AAD8HCY0_9APIA|nr:hypothetical protein POM88_039519 [Heracleum sosnowskyi]